jgi:FtsZ-interacting cell division protein ZipA
MKDANMNNDTIVMGLIGLAIGIFVGRLSNRRSKGSYLVDVPKRKCSLCREDAADNSEYCSEHWYHQSKQ